MDMDWVTPIVEGTVGIGNMISQAVTNHKNRQFQEKQNEITRNREDTAHQREVADLQAAGLSPLAATGGASTSTPLASEMEAPQIDLSAMLDAMALNEQKREFDAEMKDRERQRKHEESEGDKNRELQKKLIESNEEISKKNRESAEKISENQIKTQIEIFNQGQENLNIETEKYINDKNYENAKNLQEASEKDYQDFCRTFGYVQSEEYTEVDKYLQAKEEFNTWMNDLITEMANNNAEIDPITSESKAANNSATVGGGVAIIKAESTISNGGSESYSKSEGTATKALNLRKQFDSWEKKKDRKLYYPVFRATRNEKKENYTYKKIN